PERPGEQPAPPGHLAHLAHRRPRRPRHRPGPDRAAALVRGRPDRAAARHGHRHRARRSHRLRHLSHRRERRRDPSRSRRDFCRPMATGHADGIVVPGHPPGSSFSHRRRRYLSMIGTLCGLGPPAGTLLGLHAAPLAEYLIYPSRWLSAGGCVTVAGKWLRRLRGEPRRISSHTAIGTNGAATTPTTTSTTT